MQSQKYQGYPYVNPTVTDAPSIDAATASRWTNLPRRPIAPLSVSNVAGTSQSTSRTPQPHKSSPKKSDDEEPPVVYVDLPVDTGSSVAQSISTPDSEGEVFQDTILYDPFEDRRIELPSDSRSLQSEGSTSSSRLQHHASPTRPGYLNLEGAGSSSQQSPARSNLPAYLMKESDVYAGQTPIDLSRFPEPPPAYTEASNVENPVRVETPAPPRTQVIVSPNAAMGLMSIDRKFLTCHHCNMTGHTLVVKENGWQTHCVAIFFFIFFFPFVILVYATEWFKHTNHYCPNCNRLIGYVSPIFSKELHLCSE